MEFLLEIGTEEMPSSHLKSGIAQLRVKLRSQLEAARIEIRSLETLGTCRRLVAWGDFSPRQEDKEDVVVGPPKAAAFAPDGSPTVAAEGFARAQKTDVSKLEVVKTARGEYVVLRRVTPGRPTRDVLAEALPSIIASLSFPKMMKWDESGLRFSRPIRNIVCIWAERTLAFSLGNLKAGNRTFGHRLLCPQEILLKPGGQGKKKQRTLFEAYSAALRKNKVVLSADERRRSILSQVQKRLAPLQAQLYADDELLEALADDVEHPHVFLGEFSEDYLRLPIEVISVAMREGQKLFSVVRDGRQLARFVGVADTTRDAKSLIRTGNERVLRARLEDARFFWDQDLKIPLARRAEDLGRIVFQEKLGTYKEKRRRLRQLVSYLCDQLDEKEAKKDAGLASELCKADLLTEMVREFPSLQGKVGGLYAREEGYAPGVWRAIYEHYQPVSPEDDSPASPAGAILSIADKLDGIVGAVGIGIEATGSSDPFGLRRNANGICKVILDRKLDFKFDDLVRQAVGAYQDTMTTGKSGPEIVASVQGLCEQRLRFLYEAQGFRYDLVGAALAPGLKNIYHSYLRLKALDSLLKGSNFEPFILMAKRVNNILRNLPSFQVNEDLFVEKEEKELYSLFSIVSHNALPAVRAGDFAKAQGLVFRLQAPLDAFFDRVLVMAEDQKIKKNRLALLQAVRELLFEMADYSQVVVAGEKKEASA